MNVPASKATTLNIPGPESYLGVNGTETEINGSRGIIYQTDSDSITAMQEYARMLSESYGLSIYVLPGAENKGILYGKTNDTFVDIAIAGNGTHIEVFVSNDITLQPDTQAVNTSAPSKKASQVTGAVDLSYLRKTPKNGVQDIRYWSEGDIKFDDEPLPMGGYTVYRFETEQSQIESYIDMLCQNGFTLKASYDEKPFSYLSHSYNYTEYALTCDYVEASTRKGIFTDVYCHIDIWREDYDCWRMDASDELIFCDMGIRQGLRSNGVHMSIGSVGASAEAGLSYQSGTYTTDDGRLSATVSKAAVIVGDDTLSGKATLTYEIPNTNCLNIDGFGDGEMELKWEQSAITEGDVFVYSDFESNDDLNISLKTNGVTRTPGIRSKVCFNTLVLRVLHYDSEGDAVFYIYAEPFSGDAVEMLCATNLPSIIKGNSSSGGSSGSSGVSSSSSNWDKSVLDCLTCRGSGNCTRCGGSGYVSFGGAKASCSSCHQSGKCSSCGGSGKR